MEGGINLLPQLTENEIKAGVYRRKINIAALGFIGAVGLIVVSLFLYQLFLTFRAGVIEKRTNSATSKIVENRETEVLNRSLKEKVDQLQNILTTAVPTSTMIEQLDSAALNIPEPIRLTAISVASQNQITVEGRASGSNPSESLKGWIDNLTSSNGKDYFAKINMTTLTGNNSEGYNFSFTMEFLKKGIYKPQDENK